MDRGVGAFAKGASREFQQLDRANAAMATKMGQRMGAQGPGGGKGGRGAYIGGQIALQAQDIAIQAQMGVSASRILVQQGTQIASIFGPTGAIVGGLIAAGVLIYELVTGTEALEKAAERASAKFGKMAHENVQIGGAAASDQRATAVLEMERKRGKVAADRLKEQMDLEEKLKDIQNSNASEGVKQIATEAAEEKKAAADRLRLDQEAKKRRMESIGQTGQAIMDRADEIQAGPGAKQDKRRADRDRTRAIRRAAEEQVNQMDRTLRSESGITTRTKGLTPSERKAQVNARIKAADFQKDNKIAAEISKEGVQTLADAIAKLITK
jgi:hypothetical protein